LLISAAMIFYHC